MAAVVGDLLLSHVSRASGSVKLFIPLHMIGPANYLLRHETPGREPIITLIFPMRLLSYPCIAHHHSDYVAGNRSIVAINTITIHNIYWPTYILNYRTLATFVLRTAPVCCLLTSQARLIRTVELRRHCCGPPLAIAPSSKPSKLFGFGAGYDVENRKSNLRFAFAVSLEKRSGTFH
jgi:hypothetical protein